jgi:hypothetical protein
MKISFIAENDWANVLTEHAYCINQHSTDMEAKSICFRPHPFKYKIQHNYDLHFCSDKHKLEAKQFIEDSDVIIFGEEGHPLEHTYRTLREFNNLLGLDLLNSNKKLCIWHPGSHYRDNFKFYNNHPLRHKIYKHFYLLDLYRLSPKQDNDWPLHNYQYYNFNYEEYIKDFKSKLNKKPWTILHIPSNNKKKGTDLINEAIINLNLDSTKFNVKTLTQLPYSEVIKEKNNSLFYIDQVNNWGGYGAAAVESFFRSNLVFCSIHHLSEAIYKLTGKYEAPLIGLDLNTSSITETLSYYLNLPEDELLSIAEGVGYWIESNYNHNSIINHFKFLLNE